MTPVNAPADNTVPRWLLPLVVALHVALAAALLSSAAPFVKPALHSMEIALLAPPAAAPTRPTAAAKPAVVRTLAERKPQAVARSPEPAPTPAVAAPHAAAASETARPATESRPAPQVEAPVAPPRFDAAYLDNPRPPYPAVARRMGEEGKTVLRVFVSADGLPERIELSQSAGSPRLDEAALAAVKRWRFVPARQGEHAVAAWVLVPLVFKLEN